MLPVVGMPGSVAVNTVVALDVVASGVVDVSAVFRKAMKDTRQTALMA